MKLLNVQNIKGMTPLLVAVDQGNFEIFRLLLELYYYHDQVCKTQTQKVLPKIINMKDDRGDTCLLKAVKAKNLEMVYSLLHLGNEVVTYEVLFETDSQGRNLLHYATINQQKELIQILVKLDADKMQMRLVGDNKKKTP